ncbi:MAG: O-antigen ligase family protein [Phenylobacterium sp.]|uniref:O-antigen ligase family protein n=1 Tax=Phenylobacterium sp. TaxID=1871053 RepID=UPI00185CA532|nr:O-antigen ligase [Phenylobacterium sp.]MBA4795728.1 O-antigen ligase family protein [Phenylobacterium sp.]
MAPPGDRLTLIRLLEGLITLGLILMMSNALIGPVLDPDQTGGESNAILRLMWLPVYAAAGALAALRAPRMLRFWAPGLMLGLLVAWAFASVTWSIDPSVSQRRAVAVAATTLFGLYLAARYGGRGFTELLATAFLLLALGSYAVCLAMPSLGVHSDVNAGAWRGLWYEKNQMGATMVYATLTFAAAAALSPRRRWLWCFGALLSVGLIVMTASKTSLLAVALGLGVGAGLAAMGRGPAAAVVLVWLGVTAAALLGGLWWLAPEALFEAMGKDPSLTGRTDIWSAVLRAADERPWLGYGFAAFWTDDSAPAKWIRNQLDWVVPTAHNGWLDLLIQLGAVGVVLFAVALLAALPPALFRSRRLAEANWSAMMLAVFILQIFSESFILAHNSLPWVLAVAAVARLTGPAPAAAALGSRQPLALRRRPAQPILGGPSNGGLRPAETDMADLLWPGETGGPRPFGRRGLAVA